MKARITALLVLALFFASEVLAQGSEGEADPIPVNIAEQPTPGFEFGVRGSVGLALSSADFSSIPGVPTCQGDSIRYGGGSSGDVGGGIVVGYHPVATDGLGIGFSLGVTFRTISGSFEADERIGRTLLPGDVLAPVVSRYEVDVTGLSLSIDPSVLLRPSAGTDLLVLAGPTIALPLGLDYDGRETIVEPEGARYADGRTERNVAAGEVTGDTSPEIGIALGAAYDIQLAPTILLRPSVSGRLALSGPLVDVDWKRNGILFSIDLLLSPGLTDSTPLEP